MPPRRRASAVFFRIAGHTMAASKILIVEDEAPIRQMIAFNLSRAGFEVMEAEDCASARSQIADLATDSAYGGNNLLNNDSLSVEFNEDGSNTLRRVKSYYDMERCQVGEASRLRDVELIHLHTSGDALYAKPEYARSFRVANLFVGHNMRRQLDGDRVDYLPCFLSEIPALFRSGRRALDIALVQVSPPDRRGYCSLGVSVDVARAAVDSAKTVIAQVNRHMPRVHGDGFVHIDELDWLVEHDEPLPESRPAPPSDEEQAIGHHAAALIEDGATLQMGIGAVPDAVLAALKPFGVEPGKTFDPKKVPAIDGKALAKEVRAEVKARAEAFKATHNRAPGLHVVLVGDDPASQVYFCNSGAEANETALKIARRATGRDGVVAFERGFHGRRPRPRVRGWDPGHEGGADGGGGPVRGKQGGPTGRGPTEEGDRGRPGDPGGQSNGCCSGASWSRLLGHCPRWLATDGHG